MIMYQYLNPGEFAILNKQLDYESHLEALYSQFKTWVPKRNQECSSNQTLMLGLIAGQIKEVFIARPDLAEKNSDMIAYINIILN